MRSTLLSHDARLCHSQEKREDERCHLAKYNARSQMIKNNTTDRVKITIADRRSNKENRKSLIAKQHWNSDFAIATTVKNPTPKKTSVLKI